MSPLESDEFSVWLEMWNLRQPQDIYPDREKSFYQFSAERALLESGYCDASECWPLLYSAVRLLAGQCDGAVIPDFQGFNKRDMRSGLRLARCRWWTQKMADEIYLWIRKYRKQLARAGVDYDTIPRPERVA